MVVDGGWWWLMVFSQARPTFINFGSFFQGLRSYLRQLHYYLGVYVYCFSHFFPGSTLIWGSTLIRNSRVTHDLGRKGHKMLHYRRWGFPWPKAIFPRWILQECWTFRNWRPILQGQLSIRIWGFPCTGLPWHIWPKAKIEKKIPTFWRPILNFFEF